MNLSLEVAQGPHQGKQITIINTPFLIGRDADCHLRPASKLTAPRHCVLLARETEAFVHDLRSDAGTFVNGQAVQGECKLKEGDLLRIGPLEFRVRMEAVAVEGLRREPVKNVPAREDAATADTKEIPALEQAALEQPEEEVEAMLLDLDDDLITRQAQIYQEVGRLRRKLESLELRFNSFLCATLERRSPADKSDG